LGLAPDAKKERLQGALFLPSMQVMRASRNSNFAIHSLLLKTFASDQFALVICRSKLRFVVK
jgi:hypothetical protein